MSLSPSHIWTYLNQCRRDRYTTAHIIIAAFLTMPQDNEISRCDESTTIRTCRLINDIRVFIDILKMDNCCQYQ